jgi:glucokinase
LGTGRWAIALPGPFDYEHGIGRYEGVGKFDALRDFDLRAALLPLLPGAADAGIRDVSFHNDAEAFGLGEWWAGAARGHRSVAGITLGTGVGSCFLRDGCAVWQGPGIPPDGRVDLLRYAGKPLEETISRRALRRAYAQAASDAAGETESSASRASVLDVREIAQRARQGDHVALGVFAETFRALGTVLGPWLAAFEPTVLVVGGSIAASWDLIADPLHAGLREAWPAHARPIAIKRALHVAEAPLLGSAYLAAASDPIREQPTR